MTQKAEIPSFFLFGEPLRTVEGKFLHLEDLDDRSRPNDWNIRAHAHADLNHVFHITSGGGVMHAEDQAAVFAAPCLLLVPSRVVHGFAWEAETTGTVLTLADSYLRDLVAREPDFSNLFKAPCHLPLSATSSVGPALGNLSRELVWAAPGSGAAVEAHLLAVMVEALRLSIHAKATGRAIHGAQARLVARFRELVEAHYREPLTIKDHADRLGVTVGRLRAACRKIAAVSPLRLMQDRAILEAKRALLYSNMTVAEVGYHLGFEDPAYFSRFFAKAEGMSPRRYRAERSADVPGAARVN
ncbi:AraC family transcriptional regulator [Caulobacter sp. Root1455]|jgi:AraC family transcriptional activator of pobA|uniref:helix-turn-helix domain-containing protein n=1 Tax=unclassified Caulobacter TaxID=2648921 RepID=UPI0007015CD1|nr:MULTISPECIES: helix-turn-helix domain-containing protein [unclassified Caulobacter]KQY29963.1 AraC family transcriptional regulator [Caulobacter sp. Root487D2Y]KQY92263.1 AraC family transcriptional regulator [Caulobacter sp. Root1455]